MKKVSASELVKGSQSPENQALLKLTGTTLPTCHIGVGVRIASLPDAPMHLIVKDRDLARSPYFVQTTVSSGTPVRKQITSRFWWGSCIHPKHYSQLYVSARELGMHTQWVDCANFSESVELRT